MFARFNNTIDIRKPTKSHQPRKIPPKKNNRTIILMPRSPEHCKYTPASLIRLKFTYSLMIAAAKIIRRVYFFIHIFKADYMLIENFIHFLIVRFELFKRKRNEERDKLNKKIKKLQDRIIRLKKLLKQQII
jgi:hypothetical protein